MCQRHVSASGTAPTGTLEVSHLILLFNVSFIRLPIYCVVIKCPQGKFGLIAHRIKEHLHEVDLVHQGIDPGLQLHLVHVGSVHILRNAEVVGTDQHAPT